MIVGTIAPSDPVPVIPNETVSVPLPAPCVSSIKNEVSPFGKLIVYGTGVGGTGVGGTGVGGTGVGGIEVWYGVAVGLAVAVGLGTEVGDGAGVAVGPAPPPLPAACDTAIVSVVDVLSCLTVSVAVLEAAVFTAIVIVQLSVLPTCVIVIQLGGVSHE
tara:strand:- start:47 stop:523 length:477 start_codon:yes stop_codon:yes gene_type:complete